ncbi:MAG TPA: GAF domain-containing SpoIIE family protein phosphatase [Baekduia sp.]|nr:GAF domain-containing SpoIIE family protein phosphatase [Baekduia sp.]
MPRDEPTTPAPPATGDAVAVHLFDELLRRTHLSAPSDLARIIAGQAASIGAGDLVLYLIDYEQAMLMPLGDAGHRPLSVAGTLAGRAFRTTSVIRSAGEDGQGERLWLPLLDGTERMGVMALSFAVDGGVDDRTLAVCERYAHLAALLLVTKNAYGDAFERIRRRQRMTIASELLWELVPPLLFATDRLAIAGMLEPCYDNGGDAFDYAINEDTLHLGIFDAMGHGLAAAGVAAFALSAYRHSRRGGYDLAETYVAMDEAVGGQFPGDRYVTAVIARVDLDSGRLSWISAGHPPPLVIRDGRHVLPLVAPPSTPLGVETPAAPQVAEMSLEPGDLLLLYTDGLSEARGDDGSMFGTGGLGEFIVREAAAGQTAPETLRRLRHAIVEGARGGLRDDASALLVEWRRGTERDLMPETVL